MKTALFAATAGLLVVLTVVWPPVGCTFAVALVIMGVIMSRPNNPSTPITPEQYDEIMSGDSNADYDL